MRITRRKRCELWERRPLWETREYLPLKKISQLVVSSHPLEHERAVHEAIRHNLHEAHQHTSPRHVVAKGADAQQLSPPAHRAAPPLPPQQEASDAADKGETAPGSEGSADVVARGYSLKLRTPNGWVDDPYQASPGGASDAAAPAASSDTPRRLSHERQRGEVTTDRSAAAAAAPAAARGQHWRAYRALARMASARNTRNLSAHPKLLSLRQLEARRRLRAATQPG